MRDQLNVHLEDVELLDEVEMTTNLIIAASEAADRLPQAAIDQLLGLEDRSAAAVRARPRPDVPPQVRYTA